MGEIDDFSDEDLRHKAENVFQEDDKKYWEVSERQKLIPKDSKWKNGHQSITLRAAEDISTLRIRQSNDGMYSFSKMRIEYRGMKLEYEVNPFWTDIDVSAPTMDAKQFEYLTNLHESCQGKGFDHD